MRVVSILFCYASLFAMSLVVGTWGNDFPIAYHADEAGKVMQVLGKQERNHKHPPLLLDLSWLIHKTMGKDDNLPSVVSAGRWVSAIACALAVVMLACTTHLLVGRLSAFLVGIMLAFSPPVMVFAHYMKEDALLLMGTASIMLAVTTFWRKSRWWAASLLAVACVLTILAKYIGIVMVLCAVIAFACRLKTLCKRERIKLSLVFTITLIAAFLLLGYNWWSQWDQAIKGLAYEWDHVRSGHIDLKLSLLGALRYYGWNIPWQMQYWPILPGMIGVYWYVRKTGNTMLHITARLAVAIALTYGTLLVIGRVGGDRYALPVVVIITWFAAMSLAHSVLIHKTKISRQRWGVIVCLMVIGTCGYQAYQVTYQFDHDGRPEMGKWVQANLTASDYVVEDLYCAMPDQRYAIQTELFGKWEPRIRMKRYAAEFGTLAELRDMGVTHIAVCNYSYDRFINDKGLVPTHDDPKMLARVEHCQRFYTELFNRGDVVWAHEPRYKLPGLTSPTLVIFRLQ